MRRLIEIQDTMMTRKMAAVGLIIALMFCFTSATLAGRKEPTRQESTKLKLAQSYFLNKRNGEALKTVNEVLKSNRKYVQAHQLRGQILFALDEIDDALKEFDRALRLDKKYTEARNWRAYALVQLERYDEAMEEYNRALKDLTYTTREKIHTNIGMLYRLQKQYDLAISSLNDAVRLNPSYAKGFYELGLTFSEMGKNEKAREYFESVIKLAPGTPTALLAQDKIQGLRPRS